MARRILLVEDEDAIHKSVKINLEREGYQVFEAASGEGGIELAKKGHPEIVVLGIMLPGIGGFEVCRILRQESLNLGIIMLTAKAEDLDKIMGLQFGSDDYMTKPFNPTELSLRIKSLERCLDSKNTKTSKESVINHPSFELDTYVRKFYYQSQEVELIPTGYVIVKFSMENPGKALRREEILIKVWGDEYLGDGKIVDVNIRRLRFKIEQNPAKPRFTETIWGMGYRWFIAEDEQ